MTNHQTPSEIIACQDDLSIYEATAKALLVDLLPHDAGQNEMEARLATEKYLIHVLEHDPAPYKVIELKTMAEIHYRAYLKALTAHTGK